MAALTLFNDMVKSPSSDNSSFNPENFLIDSGSDNSLCWNQHLFTCMKLCDLEQCTSGNSTPLSVQAKAGTYRYGNTYRHKCGALTVHWEHLGIFQRHQKRYISYTRTLGAAIQLSSLLYPWILTLLIHSRADCFAAGAMVNDAFSKGADIHGVIKFDQKPYNSLSQACEAYRTVSRNAKVTSGWHHVFVAA